MLAMDPWPGRRPPLNLWMHLSTKLSGAAAEPSPPCRQVKQALWAGGIQRASKPDAGGRRHTPGLQAWEDLVGGAAAALHAGGGGRPVVPAGSATSPLAGRQLSTVCAPLGPLTPLQELIYAGQRMANDRALAEYHVPPVTDECCQLLARHSDNSRRLLRAASTLGPACQASRAAPGLSAAEFVQHGLESLHDDSSLAQAGSSWTGPWRPRPKPSMRQAP
jgi:hypothetical protein